MTDEELEAVPQPQGGPQERPKRVPADTRPIGATRDLGMRSLRLRASEVIEQIRRARAWTPPGG